MGSYLSKPRRPPPTPEAQCGQHVDHTPPSPIPPPSRKPSHAHQEHGTLSSGFVITPGGHCQIQQAWYSSVGVLPSVHWDGCHKNPVLSPPGSPGSLRIASPGRRGIHCPFPELVLKSTLSSPSGDTPDPCARESVKSDLKDKVVEEDQTFRDGRDSKDSSGSGPSAFKPLVIDGIPAAFVPKPGPLRKRLASQRMHRGGILSSSHHRNAISSSYSSLRGISQLWEEGNHISSPCWGPASCCSQLPLRPAKIKREEELCRHPSSSAPLVTDKESQGEWISHTGKQQVSSTPNSSEQHRHRRRKIPLLHPGKGDPLTLPLGPQPGYLITAEDLDMEKTTRLQWFNTFLEDKTNTAVNPLTQTTASSGLSTVPASLPDPTTNQLLEGPSTPSVLPFPGPAGVATATATSPANAPNHLAHFSSPKLLPGNYSDSKALGILSQSTPFPISVASLPGSTPVFGSMFTPVFRQSAPAPVVSTTCSNLSFGASTTSTPGSIGVGPCRITAPSFPTDEGAKIPAGRKRLQARRHHPRKK